MVNNKLESLRTRIQKRLHFIFREHYQPGEIDTITDAKYHCLDRSNYEGALIIQDMNKVIEEKKIKEFDFIYNGSCMDNIFDPVTFLTNTTKMLKVGGRILHIDFQKICVIEKL